MTENDLTELEALWQATPPGERRISNWGMDSYALRTYPLTNDPPIALYAERLPDATFAAAIHNAAPRLFAALREAWAFDDALEKSNDHTHKMFLEACDQRDYALAELWSTEIDLGVAVKRERGLLAEVDRIDERRCALIEERDAARAEVEKLRGVLTYLNQRGGLGLDIHDRIDAALEVKP